MSSRWRPYVVKRLDELDSQLGREHWEGTWPNQMTTEIALRLANEILPDEAPTPSVVPGSDGEVLFIWHKGGWTVELEFLAGSPAMVMMYRRQSRLEDIVHAPLLEHQGALRGLMLELAR